MLSMDSTDVPLAFGQGTGVAGDPADHWNFRPDGACGDIAEGNDVTPLSTDKAALLARIDALQGYGGTAGALGTSWSWYMLSPDWGPVWSGASDSDGVRSRQGCLRGHEGEGHRDIHSRFCSRSADAGRGDHRTGDLAGLRYRCLSLL